jgi:glycosyltransferase involved in cell wall biosynthesis
LPEVVGDAGLVVDLAAPGALAGALARVLTDDALHATLARAGRERAATFSWTIAARRTRALYEELAP